MKVKTSVRTTPAAIEYLLYSGIIFQTALVALTYKQIGRTARLFPGAFAYLVGAYFSILALAIVQLNRVHRERKRARLERERPAEQKKSGAPENVLQPEVVQPELVQPMVAEAPVMALQVRPRSSDDLEAGETVTGNPVSLAFGLTRTQLAVIALAFLAALKIFSWALANVIRR
jgi:hypothetical protein